MRSRITKAKTRTAKRELKEALDRFEPRVARAFREAARSVRGRASLRALSEAIARGDLDEAVRIVGAANLAARLQGVGLEPGRASLVDEIRGAFQQGGTAAARQLPRELGLLATLDLTNPEAVRYLGETLPTMIQEVGEETQEAVRQAVLRGFNEGRPAREIAREVRDSIGLTKKQGRAVSNFRQQLRTGELGNGKAPWTRRLSATERAQARSIFMAGGESSSRVDKLVDKYYDRLVNRRAKNIARTETHRAFTEGQQQLWKQAEERGLIDPTLTRRVWIVTPDDRLRPSHRAIPGMNEGGVGLNEQFQTPFGLVDGPSDSHPDLINCRCTVALEIDE